MKKISLPRYFYMKNLTETINQNFRHDNLYFEPFALQAEMQMFSY
jgi:hypothetical protein